MEFVDRLPIDSKTKRVRSIRDGVLEYLGAEIGREPADALFTVYRSPATTANAAMMMPGIPILVGHVSTEEPPPESDSYLIDSTIIDMHDAANAVTMAVENTAEIGESIHAATSAGLREVSLGYRGKLVEHPVHGLEQVDIVPHHLSTEQAGRCGESCSFLDSQRNERGTTMFNRQGAAGGATTTGGESPLIQFHDESGAVSMQRIAELMNVLPEAIRSAPLEQVQQVMPALEELIAAAKDAGATPTEPDPEPEGDKEPITDTDPEGGESMGDSEDDKDKDRGYSDAAVASMIEKANKEHASIVTKAMKFLPKDYPFADRSSEQIMTDAVATQHDTGAFHDARDIRVAFAMLQAPTKTAETLNFGDGAVKHDLTALADKEI